MGLPVVEVQRGECPHSGISVEELADMDLNGLYMIDLDGEERGKIQLRAIERLARRLEELWVDPVPRDLDDVIDTLVAGATMCVLRPITRRWRDLLLAAIDLTESIALRIHDLDRSTLEELSSLADAGLMHVVIWLHSPPTPYPLPEDLKFHALDRGGKFPFDHEIQVVPVRWSMDAR